MFFCTICENYSCSFHTFCENDNYNNYKQVWPSVTLALLRTGPCHKIVAGLSACYLTYMPVEEPFSGDAVRPI